MKRKCASIVLALALVAAQASAQEVIQYTYDGRGRLVTVSRSGGPSNGVVASYGYDKADNRTNVTVSGSSSGGSAAPAPPALPSAWAQLTLSEGGQDFTMGGNVAVFGTTTPGEVMRVMSGNVRLDGSFSVGGDTLVLAGEAWTYSAMRIGSTVTIYSSDTSVSIPVGSTGLTVQFADSTRTLRFDTQLGQVVLGTQQVTSTAVKVSASGPILAPLVVSGPASLGRLTLAQPGQDVEIGGNVSVFGTTNGDEVITVRGGAVTFDGSFNAGGDTVVLPGLSGSYNGNITGSTAILNNGVANVSIPVGSNGMVVMFDDRSAILRFDSVSGKVLLGDFVMSGMARPVVLA